MTLLESFTNPPPIDIVPLIGVLALCGVALSMGLTRKSVAWTCAIATLLYAGLASDGDLIMGFEPHASLYFILWGFFCAGVPVLVAAAVGRLAQSLGRPLRAGLISLAGAAMIPLTWAAYMTVFGI